MLINKRFQADSTTTHEDAINTQNSAYFWQFLAVCWQFLSRAGRPRTNKPTPPTRRAPPVSVCVAERKYIFQTFIESDVFDSFLSLQMTRPIDKAIIPLLDAAPYEAVDET